MSELNEAIQEMRNMRQAYDQLAQVAEGASAGKPELAAAISAKGVPTETADSLGAMAAKVTQIPQELNTGVSDFEQVIAPSPSIWNVYSVANDLAKETLPAYIPSYMSEYLQRYGTNSYFVGEYYLGYDTLELTGADGYLTCDGDFYTIAGEAGSRIVTHTLPDGTVETYPAESIVHTWHDSADGRGNRYVAFFYLANAYSFTNVTSSICPRRVALCGTCTSFVVSGANRLTDVWVVGTLGHFEGGTTGNTWNPAQVIRHYTAHNGGAMYKGASLTSLIIPSIDTIGVNSTILQDSSVGIMQLQILKNINGRGGLLYVTSTKSVASAEMIFCDKVEEINATLLYGEDTNAANKSLFNGLSTISLKSVKKITAPIIDIPTSGSFGYYALNALKNIYIPNVEEITSTLINLRGVYNIQGSVNIPIDNLYMPKLTRCTTSSLFNIKGRQGTNYIRSLIDVTVGALVTNLNINSWNPTYILSDVDKKTQLIDNIKNHILARVSDATGGTQLVFTVSTNMYNAIATGNIEWQGETMTLADAFLTKNWLLAGA